MPRSTAAPFARHQSQRAAKSQRSLASPTDAATTGSTPAAVSCRLSSLPLPISLSVGAPLEALTLLPLFLRAAWLGWMRDAIEDESLTQWHSGCQASVNNSQSGQPGWRGRGEGEDCTAMLTLVAHGTTSPARGSRRAYASTRFRHRRRCHRQFRHPRPRRRHCRLSGSCAASRAASA